ncbi:MAG: glucosamine-6-phosphate deaminase [Cyclobacteriaceae bacterium]
MKINILPDTVSMGRAAAAEGAALIRECLLQKPEVNVLLATGSSQFETINYLINEPLEWGRVNLFHLDEYIGLSKDHPASFRRYIKERLVDKLLPVKSVNYIGGDEQNTKKELQRLCSMMAFSPIDVAFIGIGENAHIAFNDPPADFDNEQPFIRVRLDEACRKQQLGEGWFRSMDEVPQYAISMSVRQIMKSRHIICSVPQARKAEAVRRSLEEDISPEVPASILREHADYRLFLDEEAAALLKPEMHT